MRRSELERRAAAAANGTAVTLEMVAKEAGVSPSTVSRILNGTARVRDAKVRAVEAAIAKLQFMPNPVARSLAGGKSMSIGVVTQSIDSPFYGEALAAIEKGLVRGKYSPLFVSGHWREGDERRCVDHLLSRRVEGIILMTSCLPDQELVQPVAQHAAGPDRAECCGERIYCLDVDSTMGARLATDYLIGQGHRRIAFICGSAESSGCAAAAQWLQGRAGCHKIPFASKLVAPGDYSEMGGQRRDQRAARLAGGVHRRFRRERPGRARRDAGVAPPRPQGAAGRVGGWFR